MARSIRIEYAGAVYHVMSRGDRREDIFRDGEDCGCFLETLGEVCERTGFRVHAYVLMGNHYHLLLETPEANLVAGMKWLQGTYSQRFNRRHRLSGHLFQGRYKAIPVGVEDPGYFRKVSLYIHLNPARAGLLDAERPVLSAYPWSSFPRFVRQAELPEWMVRGRVFAGHELVDEGRGSRRRYEALLERRAREVVQGAESEEMAEEWKALRRGWYVGDDEFREKLMELADRRARGRKRVSYRGEGLRLHDEREAARLMEEAAMRLGVTMAGLWGMRQSDPVKQAVAWWVKSRSAASDEWVRAKLEMGSRANIHRAVSAYRSPHDTIRLRLKANLKLCSD